MNECLHILAKNEKWNECILNSIQGVLCVWSQHTQKKRVKTITPISLFFLSFCVIVTKINNMIHYICFTPVFNKYYLSYFCLFIISSSTSTSSQISNPHTFPNYFCFLLWNHLEIKPFLWNGEICIILFYLRPYRKCVAVFHFQNLIILKLIINII